MKKIAKFICKHKNMIVIFSFILLIVSFVGMKLTKVNYDILVYLPKDIETIEGQNILTNDFNMGSYSIAVIDNMKAKDVLKLEEKIKKVDGVNEVASLYDVIGTSVPVDMLPNEVVEKVHKADSDLLFITFSESTSSEKTLDAVSEIRNITDGYVHQGGMSSMVLDTMNLSEHEIFIYIVIAVILCILVLELSLDSYVVPIILLANIGCAIVFNLGSNIFLGQISYITKALVAVLQLGVTTDFSIFLYHSYEKKKNKSISKEKAMVEAIEETFTSVTGSSLTTIAGFLVLCAMQLTLGRDLGIVMAKGVLIGVICVLTLFPSLLLVFNNLIEKTKHRKITPNFSKLNNFIVKHNILIFIIFLVLFIPMYLSYSKVDVYYKLDRSLPETLESIKTNKILKENYNIVSPEIVLVNSDLKTDEINEMIDKIENVDGIDFVLSFSQLKKIGITEDMINDDLIKLIKNEKYQIILINSTYDIATDELNDQITEVNNIVKKYDDKGIIAGEGPLMKDLVNICDIDFKNVNNSSIICIFLILFIVLRSISLPFLLIVAIEFAIFMNMGISYFSGTTLPFIAPIVLGTIQLGATIDYAILLTTTYLKKRRDNIDKKEAMIESLNYSGHSIFTSGMCFFAATFGVGIYSKIEMIGSLCALIARGAIISMLIVIAVLPSILLIFDKLIMKTTIKEGRNTKNKLNKNYKKATFLALIIGILITMCPLSINALEKKQTVYSKLNYDGSSKKVFVNEQLFNNDKEDTLEDYTELENILNIGNDATYTKKGNTLIWNANGKDVFYQGTTKQTLPIDLKITYKLNDKEMSVKDMLGKSGKVTIILNYKNNDKHNVLVNGKYEELYTPFVITMGTIIESGNNTNVSVTNGKVVSNGTKNIIVGISTPGLYESLKLNELKEMNNIEISYDTKKFELSSIYNIVTPKIVTPKLIENSDLEIFQKIENIYSQVDSLQLNMNKIDEGGKKLYKGSTQLKNGLAASINNLSKTDSNALTDEQIDSIINQTVMTVKNTFTNDYKSALANRTWDSVKNDLLTSDDNTVKGYGENAATNILISYLGGGEEGVTNLRYYSICLRERELGEESTCQLLEQSSGFDVETINSFKETLESEINGFGNKTVYYIAENVSKQVALSISEQTAIETAKNVSKNLVPNIANQVKNESIKVITNSLNTLYGGVVELDNGINELSTGISTFNTEGISKITNLVNSNAKSTINRVEALTKMSENYKLFTNDLSDRETETRFVFVVDSKKVPKEVKKETTKTNNDTFWDRLKNLFK